MEAGADLIWTAKGGRQPEGRSGGGGARLRGVRTQGRPEAAPKRERDNRLRARATSAPRSQATVAPPGAVPPPPTRDVGSSCFARRPRASTERCQQVTSVPNATPPGRCRRVRGAPARGALTPAGSWVRGAPRQWGGGGMPPGRSRRVTPARGALPQAGRRGLPTAGSWVGGAPRNQQVTNPLNP